MKKFFEIFCAFLIVAIPLFCIGTIGFGLYLAFNTHILIGVLSLVFVPAAFVFGLVGYFDPTVCEQLAAWLGLL